MLWRDCVAEVIEQETPVCMARVSDLQQLVEVMLVWCLRLWLVGDIWVFADSRAIDLDSFRWSDLAIVTCMRTMLDRLILGRLAGWFVLRIGLVQGGALLRAATVDLGCDGTYLTSNTAIGRLPIIPGERGIDGNETGWSVSPFATQSSVRWIAEGHDRSESEPIDGQPGDWRQRVFDQPVPVLQ